MSLNRQNSIKISASEPTVAEMARVLQEEIMLYENYCDLLRSDSELMIKLRADELDESNKTKATILLKIQTVEKSRQQIAQKIATEKGMSVENITITDICEKITQEDGRTLLGLRDRLKSVIAEIRDIQEEASYIVRSSLTWIDGSMTNLKRILAPSGTYNARGRVDHPDSFSGRTVENKA